jgi:hypothetical protein
MVSSFSSVWKIVIGFVKILWFLSSSYKRLWDCIWFTASYSRFCSASIPRDMCNHLPATRKSAPPRDQSNTTVLMKDNSYFMRLCTWVEEGYSKMSTTSGSFFNINTAFCLVSVSHIFPRKCAVLENIELSMLFRPYEDLHLFVVSFITMYDLGTRVTSLFSANRLFFIWIYAYVYCSCSSPVESGWLHKSFIFHWPYSPLEP